MSLCLPRIPPCLTLSIVRYGSRVKWSNPGKGVAPSPTPWCSSYQKGSLRVTLDYGRQLYVYQHVSNCNRNISRYEIMKIYGGNLSENILAHSPGWEFGI